MRADQRRTVIFRYFELQKLKQLEMAANQAPTDAMKQYRFLQELGRNYPEAVIQRYESGHFAVNEGVTKEYLKVRGDERGRGRRGGRDEGGHKRSCEQWGFGARYAGWRG